MSAVRVTVALRSGPDAVRRGSGRTREGYPGCVVGGALAGRVVALCGALLVLVLAAGCATASGVTGPPVPTFPAPGAAAQAGAGAPAPDGSIPTECGGMLTVEDLNALLGLPLGSVGVRTTIGVAEPSVGRTQRVACRYSGTAVSPARGTLLDLNVARYEDEAAAARQWSTNAGVERGERRDLAIGAARAALFERPRETVLMVTYDDDTITMVLPEGPRPPERTRADVLVDLALRVLPTVGPPRGPASVEPPPSSATPAVAAG